MLGALIVDGRSWGWGECEGDAGAGSGCLFSDQGPLSMLTPEGPIGKHQHLGW